MSSIRLQQLLISAAGTIAVLTAATTAEATNYKYTIPVCVVQSGSDYSLKLGKDETDTKCLLSGGTADGAIRVKNGDHHEITFALQAPRYGLDWYKAARPFMIGSEQTPDACGNGVAAGTNFKAFSLELPTAANPYSFVFHDDNSGSKGCFKYSLAVGPTPLLQSNRRKAGVRKLTPLDPIVVND
jgi:hypothetical protein